MHFKPMSEEVSNFVEEKMNEFIMNNPDRTPPPRDNEEEAEKFVTEYTKDEFFFINEESKKVSKEFNHKVLEEICIYGCFRIHSHMGEVSVKAIKTLMTMFEDAPQELKDKLLESLPKIPEEN